MQDCIEADLWFSLVLVLIRNLSTEAGLVKVVEATFLLLFILSRRHTNQGFVNFPTLAIVNPALPSTPPSPTGI